MENVEHIRAVADFYEAAAAALRSEVNRSEAARFLAYGGTGVGALSSTVWSAAMRGEPIPRAEPVKLQDDDEGRALIANLRAAAGEVLRLARAAGIDVAPLVAWMDATAETFVHPGDDVSCVCEMLAIV